MPIPLSHGLRRVPHELVDNSLIDPGRREVGCETVPIGVKPNFVPMAIRIQAPLRVPQGLPQSTIRMIRGEGLRPLVVADNVLPVRM